MPGGEQNYVHFGYETIFKTAVVANKTFGENVSVRSVDIKNNFRRRFNLGNRSAVDLVAGKFEGALSIEFDISDPWFMKGVLGDISTSGTGPYYHTFTEANRPPSMTIENGISGSVRQYLGAIIGDCKISQAVGDEPAKVTLTIMYADEKFSQASGIVSQASASDGVYPFSYASIEYPTGTPIANTESLEMTITNNGAIKHALGSRKGVRYDMRARTYDVTTTNFFDDPTTYLKLAYGLPGATAPVSGSISGQAGILISFDNGETSAATRKWLYRFGHAVIDRHGLGTQSIEAEQMETVDIIPESVIIQCANNTSAMP